MDERRYDDLVANRRFFARLIVAGAALLGVGLILLSANLDIPLPPAPPPAVTTPLPADTTAQSEVPASLAPATEPTPTYSEPPQATDPTSAEPSPDETTEAYAEIWSVGSCITINGQDYCCADDESIALMSDGTTNCSPRG
jgi:hypothetical protein